MPSPASRFRLTAEVQHVHYVFSLQVVKSLDCSSTERERYCSQNCKHERYCNKLSDCHDNPPLSRIDSFHAKNGHQRPQKKGLTAPDADRGDYTAAAEPPCRNVQQPIPLQLSDRQSVNAAAFFLFATVSVEEPIRKRYP